MPRDEKANILIVDDSPSKLLAMSAALAELDQNIITADSGRDALRKLLQHEFAVILLDVNMPEMDGFETAALVRARKNSAHVPILFITAYGDDAHATQGYSLGAVDYLLTPVVPEILRAKVSVFVELFQKSRQIEQQAEERIALANEQAARRTAETANRIKDEFLATLSHELRTPLNSVLGWVQLLKMRKLDDQAVSEGLEVIERNARLQAKIIEDLLDVSRIISGKLQLELRDASVLESVEAAIASMLPMAEAKQIEIGHEFEAELPALAIDPGRLQQVVSNLLSNAIKFSVPGERVQVLVRRVQQEIEIAIIDRGEGITPEFLPHVFERFRQADASTTRRTGGLGIGLAIVRQISELHGGRVAVSSSGPGQGSQFSVFLPLSGARSGSETTPKPDSQSTLPTHGPLSLAGIRVLLVEDQQDARDLVQRILTGYQAEVAAAANGVEALELLDGFEPDVLVSDIGMPDLDGYGLIRKVRERRDAADLPAIALTAYARTEERGRALDAGYQVHISKPIQAMALVSAIAALVAPPADGQVTSRALSS